jgi:hypothetical protein
MPRRRRTMKHRRAELTDDQFFELLLGPSGENVSAFASENDRREAWEEHRERLLARRERSPGRRAWAWWHYESPEPRDPTLTQHDQLDAMGELDDAERAALHALRVPSLLPGV